MGNKFRTLAIYATSLSSIALLSGFSFPMTGVLHKPSWVAHPPIHVKNGATSTYQNGFSPSQIRGAYGIAQLSSSSYDGKGVTVAIVDAYGSPTIQNDLNSFDNQFGLPSANLSIVNMGGHRKNAGWALETSLDVEWVHAIAPNASIMLVEAKSASTKDLLAAIDYAASHGAQVVSNSWGGSEFSGESSYDSHFNHPGIVYTASSGDNGAGVSWPAVSPDVVGVGGTTLSISNASTSPYYGSETAWSGSGGGVSSYESVPSYQSGINLSGRGVPDVSWDANPASGAAVYDSTSYNGQSGWFEVGGTSFGAPSWAAVAADIDQGLMSKNQPYDSTEFLTNLYAQAQSTTTQYFHDITSGSNGTYSAGTGYDLVTGEGSPVANNLIPTLVSQGSSNAVVSSTSGSGGGSTSGGASGSGHGKGKPKK